jgi:hypothetical protein
MVPARLTQLAINRIGSERCKCRLRNSRIRIIFFNLGGSHLKFLQSENTTFACLKKKSEAEFSANNNRDASTKQEAFAVQSV